MRRPGPRRSAGEGKTRRDAPSRTATAEGRPSRQHRGLRSRSDGGATSQPGRGQAGSRGQALSPMRVRQGSTRLPRTAADRHRRARSTAGDQPASRPPARRGAAVPYLKIGHYVRFDPDDIEAGSISSGCRCHAARRKTEPTMGSPAGRPTRPGAYSTRRRDTNHLRSKIGYPPWLRYGAARER